MKRIVLKIIIDRNVRSIEKNANMTAANWRAQKITDWPFKMKIMISASVYKVKKTKDIKSNQHKIVCNLSCTLLLFSSHFSFSMLDLYSKLNIATTQQVSLINQGPDILNETVVNWNKMIYPMIPVQLKARVEIAITQLQFHR